MNRDHSRLEIYLEEIKKFMIGTEDSELFHSYTIALLNTLTSYGMNRNLEKMSSYLDEINNIFNQHSTIEIGTVLARSLSNATSLYSKMGEKDKAINCCASLMALNDYLKVPKVEEILIELIGEKNLKSFKINNKKD